MPTRRIRTVCRLGIGVALISSLAFAVDGVADGPASIKNGNKSSFISRHFRFVTVDSGSRFRYVDKGPGAVTDRDLQYKLSTRVQLDLAPEGKTYIQARGESGRSFQSSWDYFGPGPNKAYWSFNLKALYVGQKIGSHWEAQAGGIEYDWGAGTEATYATMTAGLRGTGCVIPGWENTGLRQAQRHRRIRRRFHSAQRLRATLSLGRRKLCPNPGLSQVWKEPRSVQRIRFDPGHSLQPRCPTLAKAATRRRG